MTLEEADLNAIELNESYTKFCPAIDGDCRQDCVHFVKADSIIKQSGSFAMSGGFSTGKYYPAEYGVSKPRCNK